MVKFFELQNAPAGSASGELNALSAQNASDFIVLCSKIDFMDRHGRLLGTPVGTLSASPAWELWCVDGKTARLWISATWGLGVGLPTEIRVVSVDITQVNPPRVTQTHRNRHAAGAAAYV